MQTMNFYRPLVCHTHFGQQFYSTDTKNYSAESAINQSFNSIRKQVDATEGEALYQLGLSYRDSNPKYALQLLHKAAKKCAIAQNDLGMLYLNGWCGVTYDKVRGLNYLHLANKNKCPEAAANLAGIYETGEIVPMNLKKALRYYKSVENSHIPDIDLDIFRVTFKALKLKQSSQTE